MRPENPLQQLKKCPQIYYFDIWLEVALECNMCNTCKYMNGLLKPQTQLQNLSCVMRNASIAVGVAGIDCVAWTSDVLSNPYGPASARRLRQVSRWEQVLEA